MHTEIDLCYLFFFIVFSYIQSAEVGDCKLRYVINTKTFHNIVACTL